MTNAARATVEAVYREYAAGNLEAAAAGLADDIDWAILAPAYLFDFAGPRRGRASVLDVLQEIRRTFELLAYEPRIVVAEGEHACVYAIANVRDRSTGRATEIELCDVMRLDGGRIVWFREFIDAVRAATLLFGGSPPGAKRA
jgi:ketosteroid isomerase-like protein